MDKAKNVVWNLEMKAMLTAALVVMAACAGILLGLTAPVLGQSAADRSETRQLARHFE
jgi:hypothetical protein